MLAAGLFAGLIVALRLGRALGARAQASREDMGTAGLRAIEAAVFALLGLLIAFTFQGAATRFDARRTLIVEEANALGTAWLRLDLLPAESQAELRPLLRRYTDARLAAHQVGAAAERAAALGELPELQAALWVRAVPAAQATSQSVVTSVLPALNAVFDLATTQQMAQRAHPPRAIFVLLLVLMLLAALLAGWAMAGAATGRARLHELIFATALTLALYVIVDLEYPRHGLLNVTDFDGAIRAVRATMDAPAKLR
jgi:hypothetical protein